ncbi:MAG: transcription termination/antitermination protein NusA [SAR202 cluster bacterium]|nr:transcription termination/antitermination protein NusA [SAR202 cluster bacterium]|tara:strand:+ start:421 stop:2004 length:1584 start_codon:yes stop_codon:yes gene_type:complete
MKSDFLIAVTQLAAERHLPREAVVSAIEAALASAYKKDSVLAGQEISVTLDPANGELKLFSHKIAVETVLDPQREISLVEAKKIEKGSAVGDVVLVEGDIQTTGRIAAQAAKQVVLQRLREAERDLVFEEYSGKEGDILTGTVQRVDSRNVTVDLGRTEGILPLSEQVFTERYRPGQKLKLHVSEVRRSVRGPEVVVSRNSKELLRRLFEMEVPEIFNGVVEIKAVAREAGSRSKVAVYSRQEGVDPVGSCVGLRGVRIQNVVNELQGEKIDVVQWHPDPKVFLANSLSPCPVSRVDIGDDASDAVIVVPDQQLSLAIGKEGQNARLCAKLSGLMVNIKSLTEVGEERLSKPEPTLVSDVESPEVMESSVPAEDVIGSEAEALGTLSDTIDTNNVQDVDKFEEQIDIDELSTDGLSIEEQLAEVLVDNGSSEEVVDSAEAPELTEISETVWDIPKVPEQPQTIRFAEDIMGSKGDNNPRRKGRAGKTAGTSRAGEERGSRGTKRSRRNDFSMDEGDDLMDDDLGDLV